MFPDFRAVFSEEAFLPLPVYNISPSASRIRSGEKHLGKASDRGGGMENAPPPSVPSSSRERVGVPLALMVGCLVHRWARGRPSGGDQGIFFSGGGSGF